MHKLYERKEFKSLTNFILKCVGAVGIFILTQTIVTFRVQNLLKIVITRQIMTCLLVIPKLKLPYPNLPITPPKRTITLSKLTY